MQVGPRSNSYHGVRDMAPAPGQNPEVANCVRGPKHSWIGVGEAHPLEFLESESKELLASYTLTTLMTNM